jgi:hypothetical protein
MSMVDGPGPALGELLLGFTMAVARGKLKKWLMRFF